MRTHVVGRGRRSWKIWLFWLVVLLVLGGLAFGVTGATKQAKAPKPLFPASDVRSDAPAAIDKELAARYKTTEAKAAKLLTQEGDHWLLKTKFGTVTLPMHAKRVAVIRLEDPMIALGAPMVAAHNTNGFYLHDELVASGAADIAVNEASKAINLEQVQAAKPDLIILRDSFDRGTYEALRKIAPVAVLNLQDSETTLLVLGRLLDREPQAKARLHQYYDTVKGTRVYVKGKIGNEPVALLRVLQREVRLYPYSANAINRFMSELLNLRPDPMAVAHDEGDTNVISPERLPDIQAKYLLVSSGYGPSSYQKTSAAEAYYERLQQDPLWQTIPAVKAGHVWVVDPMIWTAHGIIAKEKAMAQLRAYVATLP